MRTAVISDLHLGARGKADLLEQPPVRERLMREVEGADRVVLLGDTLELRDAPLATVLEEARPFFDELGDAVGGAQVVIVAGNHDHELAAPILDRHAMRGGRPLGPENLGPPGSSGPAAAIARRMPGAEVVIAYPGLWLRDDVYAIHGHYLDYHLTIPTLERLAIGLTGRIAGRRVGERATCDDYEAVLAPVYTYLFRVAQAATPGRDIAGGGFSMRMWSRMRSRDGRRARLTAKALRRVLVPAGVGLANRAGLGPLSAEITTEAIARAGVEGMGEVLSRLGVDSGWTIFGHTHRSGPLPDERAGWTLASGCELINTGSWVLERSIVGAWGARSPYWPGVVAWVDREGRPERARLLDDLDPAELDGAAD